MPAQKARDMLVEIGDGGSPETYVPLAGLRTKTLSFSAGPVEATDADSPGRWRELIDGAGVKRLSVTGAGVFRDGAASDAVRLALFDQAARSLRLTAPGLGVFTGRFQIANLDYAGDYDGEATYSVSLVSAGEIGFSPS